MERPNTYVACAMSSMPEEEYEVFRQKILEVCDEVRAQGLVPYSEPFEKSLSEMGYIGDEIRKNAEVLDEAIRFVLIYTHKQATSALIELGHAWARRLPIIVFAARGVKLPFYLQNEESNTMHNIRLVEFDSVDEVPGLLRQMKI